MIQYLVRNRTRCFIGLSLLAMATQTAEAGGQVVVWGSNYQGWNAPPSDLTNAIAVTASSHNVALKDDGTVAVWGCFGPCDVPVGISNIVAVAAGGGFSMALKNDGTVVAWTSNDQGD